MAEETTTEAVVQDTGAESTALPVQDDQATAATTTTTEEPTASQGESEDSLPTADDKLKSFAKGQGIEDVSDLSPREMALLKSAYDNKAEYERNRQKASELEKSLAGKSDEIAEQVAENTGQDPELLKRLQRVEVREAVRDFWNTPLDDSGTLPNRALEGAMIQELQSKPHLAGDLESLYASAMLKSGQINSVKSQAKRETLEALAHKQQAAVPTGSATNPGTTSKAKPFAEMSISEMEKHLGFAEQ